VKEPSTRSHTGRPLSEANRHHAARRAPAARSLSRRAPGSSGSTRTDASVVVRPISRSRGSTRTSRATAVAPSMRIKRRDRCQPRRHVHADLGKVRHQAHETHQRRHRSHADLGNARLNPDQSYHHFHMVNRGFVFANSGLGPGRLGSFREFRGPAGFVFSGDHPSRRRIAGPMGCGGFDSSARRRSAEISAPSRRLPFWQVGSF
jgi:hypothetical protein